MRKNILYNLIYSITLLVIYFFCFTHLYIVHHFTILYYEFHIYNDDSVEQGVLNFAKKIKADLIGIATHGRKGLSHFFNGSISEDLVNHAHSPVITFKLEKPEHRKNFP